MKLKIEITDERIKSIDFIPSTSGSCAIDLKACIDTTMIIGAGHSTLIPVGFKMQLEEGYGAFILPRSGLGAKQGGVLGNLIGLIDSDYRGNVFVSLWNRNSAYGGTIKNINVNPLDRIAQMVILKTESFNDIEFGLLDSTERGEGGFGSTGER